MLSSLNLSCKKQNHFQYIGPTTARSGPIRVTIRYCEGVELLQCPGCQCNCGSVQDVSATKVDQPTTRINCICPTIMCAQCDCMTALTERK